MDHPEPEDPQVEQLEAPPRRYTYTVQAAEGTVGAFIREERIKRGWRQKDLADMVGLWQAQISAFERGEIKMPDPAALARIDAAFGYEPGELLGRTGWQGARRRVESAPPPGSIVVLSAKERPILEAVVERVAGLNDDELAQLEQYLDFIEGARPAGEDQDSDEPNGDAASA